MNSAMLKLIIGIGVGIGIGYIFANQQNSSPPQTDTDKAIVGDGPCANGAAAMAWRNPMNPAITSATFTKDSMGMDYLPICAEDAAKSSIPGSVSIDPTVVQNIGVRTSLVKKEALSHAIQTIGRISLDEEHIAHLYPKVEGWVEELFVDKTGSLVNKDSMLLSVYSPQLIASSDEYLLALKHWQQLKDSPFPDIRQGAKSLMDSSLKRLELLDIPEHQLRSIREQGLVPKAIHIHSPFRGTIMKISVRKGQRIRPNTELYTIADLSRLWVMVDLYDDDLAWVRKGDRAEMRVNAIPGKIFTGKVDYIYPYMSAKTRTVKLRLVFDNTSGELKPEMFADVRIHTRLQKAALTIPSEAIIRTGIQEQVLVQRGIGKYEPRLIKIGLSATGRTQILSGLKEGEEVVSSAQFLIDSESKLNEATAKMMQVKPADNTADAADMSMDDMGDMSMDDMDAMP